MNTSLIKELLWLEMVKKGLTEREKEINERKESLERQIADMFVEEGLQSVKVEGRTVYLKREIFASPTAGRPAVCAALKADGLEQYVAENYNDQSLRAYVREAVESKTEEAQLLAADAPDPDEQERLLAWTVNDLSQALPENLRRALKVATKFSVGSRKA